MEEESIPLADHAHAALGERASDRGAADVHDSALRHHDAAPSASPRAKPEIDVFVVEGVEERVESAQSEEARAVHCDRASEREERIPGRHRRRRTSRKSLCAAPAVADPSAAQVRNADRDLGDTPCFVEHERRRGEHIRCIECVTERAERAGIGPRVGVEQEDDLVARARGAAETGSAKAEIAIVLHERDPAMRLHDVARCIGAPVVDDDHLGSAGMRARCRERRRKGRGEQVGPIPVRNHDTHVPHGSGSLSETLPITAMLTACASPCS